MGYGRLVKPTGLIAKKWKAKIGRAFPVGCSYIRMVACLGLDFQKTMEQKGFSQGNEGEDQNENTSDWYEAKRGLSEEKIY